MSRVPRIRFKGFEEDWEQRKVGAICSISTGKSNTQDRVEDGKYPFYVRSSIVERSNRYLFDEEAVLTVGDGVGTGKVFHYVDGKYDLHQRVYRMFDFEKDISAKYFFYYFSNNFYDRVMAMTAKTSVDSVRYEVISDMDIIVPHIKEQKFIADIFQNFDHLITLHQRKLEKLKIIKKSMLENLFPQNGEKTPKIRFSGFTEDWEQRKLGEVTTSYSGGTPNVSNCEYYGDEIPFIRSGEINNFHTDLFITEKGLVNSSAAMVKEGDILYALYGATSGEVSRSKLKGAINQAILAILPKAKYDSEYIAQWLKTKKRCIVDTYLQGGQGNLSGNIVKNFIVDFSSYNEQLSIGNFASSLDHLITLHQSKLEKLQKIKKSMLESMFV